MADWDKYKLNLVPHDHALDEFTGLAEPSSICAVMNPFKLVSSSAGYWWDDDVSNMIAELDSFNTSLDSMFPETKRSSCGQR